MLSNLPIATWVLDQQTRRFIKVNAATVEQYGYTQAEFRELDLSHIWPGEAAESVLAAIDRPGVLVRSSGPWRHRRKDGHMIDVLVSAHRPSRRHRNRLMMVAQNVTHLELERVRLNASEERLRLALATGRMGTWEWSPRDDVIVWDGPPEDGPGSGRWRGSRADFLELLHAEDRAPVADAMDRSVSEGVDLEVELRVTGRDGSPRWILATGRVIPNAPGGAVLLVGLGIDITARKLAEARAARTEKLRVLGQLAAGVAHDLNQSLALIGGYGELALQALAHTEPDADMLAECVSIIRNAAIGSGQTVKQLLTFARGHEAGPAQPIEVVSLLREVVTLTSPHWRDVPEAEGRPIRLELSHDDADGPLTMLGWSSSLHDALTNLVFNAVDALPHGGIIRLSARCVARGIEIEVADNGLGMTEEVRAHVFEPFFTTRGERGTGLGLAQVLQIVLRHDGEVSISSTPGQGTACRLVFPAADAPTAAANTSPSTVTVPARQLRVLIVDDLPALAGLLKQIIQHRGHLVVAVGSGEEALAWLERSSFDFVISDLGLGAGMNGWELAEQVKTRWPGLLFGLATGWAATIDPVDARDRGVMSLLAKPYTMRDLLKFLEPAERPSGQPTPDAGPD